MLTASLINEFGFRAQASTSVWIGLPIFFIAAVLLLLSLVVYLFAHGGIVIALRDILLGRPPSVSGALTGVWNNIGSLLGVALLTGLAVLAGSLLLLVPGIYLACRLLVGVPAVVLERSATSGNRLSPTQALSRSFQLTKGKAFDALLIILVTALLTIAASLLLSLPFQIPLLFSASDSAARHIWTALGLIGSTAGSVLVNPLSLILITLFYFDRRVRLEGFTVQHLSGTPPSTASDITPAP